MKSLSFRSVILLTTALIAGLILSVNTAAAATVNGTIQNGTTGDAPVDVSVAIINPSAGMMAQQTVEAVDGRFAVENLEPGIYMARVEYKDVMYNYDFQITATDSVEVEVAVVVYETSSSWDGVKIVVPHFTAARHSDHLVVERVYDIYNESEPPRTIAGEDGQFRFPLPPEMHNFNGLWVQYGNVPIEREPLATDDPGIRRLDYPIRPGVTRVVMGYTVEYETAAFAMTEKLQHDIEQFTIFATDMEMKVTSSSHELLSGEGPHASVSSAIKDLKKGDVLSLAFEGGITQQATTGGPQPVVSVVPNSTESVSSLLMIILLLALVAFVGIAVRGPRVTGADALHLKEHRDILVRQLATLDDVHETGAIPAATYQSKRSELKNQIASLMFRLNARSATARGSGKQATREKRSST
jgi:hypothetical protein